jgi:hypothetical protein
MRLWVLLIAAILASSPAAGQPADTAPRGTSASPPADGTGSSASTDLPVSLDRIREALGRPVPAELLKRFADVPTFRSEIEERRRIEELLSTLEFKGGPTPPGGLYGYEQQRLVFPPTDLPLAQPYAMFNTGQLLTVAAENLAAHAIAGPLVELISKANKRRAEDNARRVVDAAIDEYCSGKPDRGAGIVLCDQRPAER